MYYSLFLLATGYMIAKYGYSYMYLRLHLYQISIIAGFMPARVYSCMFEVSSNWIVLRD